MQAVSFLPPTKMAAIAAVAYTKRTCRRLKAHGQAGSRYYCCYYYLLTCETFKWKEKRCIKTNICEVHCRQTHATLLDEIDALPRVIDLLFLEWHLFDH